MIRIHVLDFLSIYTKYVIYNIYIEILGLSLTKLLSLGKMPANIRKQHQGHSSWHWVRLQSGGSGKLDPESSRHMIESGLVCAPKEESYLHSRSDCRPKKENMSNFPVGHQMAAWQGWALLMLCIEHVHLRNDDVSE